MILQFLDSLDWVLSFFLVAAVFILFTTVCILFVRKAVNLKRLKDSHDMTGIIFTNLSALYAVLLGFTIVNAQSRFDEVKKSTQIEAACLIDLYRDVDLFSEQDQTDIKKAIIAYAGSVVHHEWSGDGKHDDTGRKFKDLLNCYFHADIQTPKQTIWYTESISELSKLGDLRTARILGAQESINPAMWAILILGGLAMLIFLCFFGPEKPVQHLVMASILAVTIASALYLIHCLDTTFTGSISIQSDALKNLLQVINEDFSM